PVRALLGGVRALLLSPDGVLSLVPFGALVNEEGRYLLEEYSISYLSTGRDLVRLRSVARPQQGPVLLAGPDFLASGGSSNPPEVVGARRSPRSMDMAAIAFSPLPETSAEAQAVAGQLAGVRVLQGAEATEAAVKALHGPSVLHVATHGFFLSDT